MYLSYIFNTASGATIVLFGASLYCLGWLTNFLHDRYILQNHPDGKSDFVQTAQHQSVERKAGL
jgi:manganese/iron transport system permease protein/iron/zinc/copper transport system permease protein